MNDFETEKPQSKKKTWQVIVILVLIGLAVNLVLPKILDLRHSVEVVREMTWWVVIAGVAMTALAG